MHFDVLSEDKGSAFVKGYALDFCELAVDPLVLKYVSVYHYLVTGVFTIVGTVEGCRVKLGEKVSLWKLQFDVWTAVERALLVVNHPYIDALLAEVILTLRAPQRTLQRLDANGALEVYLLLWWFIWGNQDRQRGWT